MSRNSSHLRLTPSPARLFFSRLWREGGGLILLLPALWLLPGMDPAGWIRWIIPVFAGYSVLISIGLRARVQRMALWLESDYLVNAPGTLRERRLALELLDASAGFSQDLPGRLLGSHRLRLKDGRWLRLDSCGFSAEQIRQLDQALKARQPFQ